MLEGQELVAVLPTGFGKSLLFQLPPFLIPQKHQKEENIVIVVSPLNSIITDQINALLSRGILADRLSCDIRQQNKTTNC